MASPAAISLRNLTKVYPIPFRRQRVEAVRDVSFDVHAGEVYGLLGPNGSGKSTTLKIILGLVSPTQGETKIFGTDSALVRSRESVGFLRGKALETRINELLELVSLGDSRDRRLATYSKGMLQRIGLAQALINRPR